MIIFESPRKRANRFLLMLKLLGILTIASIILTAVGTNSIQQIQTLIQTGVEVTDGDIDILIGIVLCQHSVGFSDYCRRNSGFCSSASDHEKSGN